MKNIAVLTGGGDAPGMNAALRSSVRSGLNEGWDLLAVHHGYKGLMEGNIEEISARDVGNIFERAGSVIGCSRPDEFKTRRGLDKALDQIDKHQLDGLVIIGGEGTMNGANELRKEGVAVAGVAATIDNDIPGSDMAIGVDTALNVALNAIDQLRVTASSLRRGSIVEVMGRDHGYLALQTGLAGGAEAIVIPEMETDPDELAETVRSANDRGKTHVLIVVAEGAEYNAKELARYFRTLDNGIGYQLRTTILGHIQRGGTPTAFDRILGSRLGARAIRALASGNHGVLAGWTQGEPTLIPLDDVAGKKKSLDTELMNLAKILAQ